MSDAPTGTLAEGEPHPVYESAVRYFASIPLTELMEFYDAFASCAIEDNRTAEICHETMRRLLNGEPVSDRYLLGLMWILRDMRDKEAKIKELM